MSAAAGKGEECVPCKTCQLQQALERPGWVAGGFPIRGMSLELGLGPEWGDPRPGYSGEPVAREVYSCPHRVAPISGHRQRQTQLTQHADNTKPRHGTHTALWPQAWTHGDRKPEPPTLTGQAYLPMTPSEDSRGGHSGLLWPQCLDPQRTTPH